MHLAEELIAHILALALAAHPSTALPLLTTSKQLHRIALPLLLAHIHLSTRTRADKLAAFLTVPCSERSGNVGGDIDRRRLLRRKIRSLTLDSLECADAFAVIASLLTSEASSKNEKEKAVVVGRLALCLNTRPTSAARACDLDDAADAAKDTWQWQHDADKLHAALLLWPDTREIVLLDDDPASGALLRLGGARLTRRMMTLQYMLSDAIPRWPSLESVDIQCRLFYSPVMFFPSSRTVASAQQAPNVQDAEAEQAQARSSRDPIGLALAAAPNLRVVRAVMMTLLSTFLAALSASKTLTRIELLPFSPNGSHLRSCSQNRCSIPESIFTRQLKSFPRLQALIRAGDEHIGKLARAEAEAAQAECVRLRAAPQGESVPLSTGAGVDERGALPGSESQALVKTET